MDDVGPIISVVLVALGLMYLGFCLGEQSIYKEAVKKKAACWAATPNGEVIIDWLCDGKE